MTESEFVGFRARSIKDYAAAQIEAGRWPSEMAEVFAAKQTDELLPDGVATPGMLLLVAENADGATLGTAWVALKQADSRSGWIYQLEVVADERGKGYGRVLLAAVEDEVATQGVASIGLNVFGSNLIARALYDSAGYEVSSVWMRKALPQRG